MISTKWFKGENLDDILSIRKSVYCYELHLNCNLIQDEYDLLAYSVLLYENQNAVATGRLLFKSEKYIIDKVCVLKEFRNNNYEDLIIRMLVRKAVDMGAECTYTYLNNILTKSLKLKDIFLKIGFTINSEENGRLEMVKYGDVGGQCGK